MLGIIGIVIGLILGIIIGAIVVAIIGVIGGIVVGGLVWLGIFVVLLIVSIILIVVGVILFFIIAPVGTAILMIGVLLLQVTLMWLFFGWIPGIIAGVIGGIIIGVIAGVIAGAIVLGAVAIILAIIGLLAGGAIGAVGLGVVSILFGIFIVFPITLILFPLTGMLINCVLIPLSILGGVMGISMIAFGINFAELILEAITGIAGMIILGIEMIITKIAVEILQTTLISEIVTTVVMFLQKLVEIAPLAKIMAYPLEMQIGVVMLGFAILLFLANIVFYPFNWIWIQICSLISQFLKMFPILDLRNLYKPLGWE